MTRAGVRAEHGCLHIPSELHFLMAGAQQIAVVERRGYFYVWPYDYNFIASHVRLLARSKLRGAQNLTIYDFGGALQRRGSVPGTGRTAGMPDARVIGIGINPHAVSHAAEQLGAGARVRQGSLYDLRQVPAGSIDVIFSMGVLMNIAHKYPRNYEELYRLVGSGLKVDYTVYQREDFRSRESAPFYMALLIGR